MNADADFTAPAAAEPTRPDAPHSLGFEDAIAYVTSTNPTYALEEVEVRGIRYPAFANAPRTVPDMVVRARAAHRDGAGTHLVYNEERLTYDAFTAEIAAIATALRDRLGVGKGDRVAIVTRNYPELLTALLAVSSIGGVAVLLNAWWTTQELQYGLTDSGVRVVIADGPRLDRLRALEGPLGLALVGTRDGQGTGAHDWTALRDAFAGAPMPDTAIAPDDDFAIMYSSGSTGAPKGVIQTHRGVVSAVWTWMMQPQLRPVMAPKGAPPPPVLRPSYLVVTPLFHVTALYPLYMLGIPVGAQVTLMHRWDASEAIRIIQREGVTRFIGVPTQTADLTEAVRASGAELPTLAYLGSGGAKRPAAHVARLAASFPASNVATGWGMTETCALGIGMMGADYLARPDAAGRLYPPIQRLRIMDEDGRECPTGAVGEIQVKSVSVMRGYLGRPEETAETLKDGWLATGDLGFVDAEGFVTILDRKKNIVIRGGENVSCAEVEEALHAHPCVIEACAFPVPHERLGEVVGAALHLRPGTALDTAGVAAFLDGTLAPFKIPAQVWTQDSPLPRGTTDKTDRHAVRAACLKG